MYPANEIFDIALFPTIRGHELVERLVYQAAPLGPGLLVWTDDRRHQGRIAVLLLSRYSRTIPTSRRSLTRTTPTSTSGIHPRAIRTTSAIITYTDSTIRTAHLSSQRQEHPESVWALFQSKDDELALRECLIHHCRSRARGIGHPEGHPRYAGLTGSGIECTDRRHDHSCVLIASWKGGRPGG